jgi:hypothetical protein
VLSLFVCPDLKSLSEQFINGLFGLTFLDAGRDTEIAGTGSLL